MKWEERTARVTDFAMCAAMNAVQMRHRLNGKSKARLEKYIAESERLSPEEFFAIPSNEWKLLAPPVMRWPSPVTSGYAGNDHTHVDIFLCEKGACAPTVLMLHALMSTSDIGYRGWAREFNALGWNACFLHLPFHYSRRPHGYLNGELAVTADLVRTGEGLRQGVIELRQVMAMFRHAGCREFGLWATSYGGWIGALLSFVERDFRFIALMAPIVNVAHAIWESGAAVFMRNQLRKYGIPHELVERHFHLTSPMHHRPLAGSDRVIFGAGDYDRLVLQKDIQQLHEQWDGSMLLNVPQGHYGLRMMPALLELLKERGFFN